MTQRDKHGEGPLHGLSGKKQTRFNPKHIKTFQSSPSPLNISCSLQTFLWSQRPQLGTSSKERWFFSIHVLWYPPFSLHNKSFYLLCSSEPRRQREIWSCAVRNTLRIRAWIALSHTFCGCLIITFMLVSEQDPTQASFRQWNHTVFSYFILSVFGQQSGISNGEKMSLCCISTELILLAWLSLKAHERISKTKLQ